MGPPTEQLIRDYLNRLSVAARGRLSPEERRTLIERTRQLIEQKADFAGRPTTLEVGRVLARLGDPAALVDQEVRRLGGVTDESEHHVVEGGFLAKVLRREPAWVRGAHWSPPAHFNADDDDIAWLDDAQSAEQQTQDPGTEWRAQNGHDPALIGAVVDGTVDGEVLDGAGPDAEVLEGEVLEGEVLQGAVPDDAVPGGAAPDALVLDAEVLDNERDEPARPQWPGVVARDARRGNGRRPHGRSARSAARSEMGSWETLNGAAIPTGAAVNGGLLGPGDPPGAGPVGRKHEGIDSAWQLEEPVTSPSGSAVRRLLAGLHDWSRERPMEAVTLVLLGLGGVIYPPVFVLGAALALFSRLWDYRDKWLGLALPVVLTVIGLAFGVALGGRAHGFHEGWVWLNISSRLAALFGTGYLAWRTNHGRRAPAAPPWNKPHKLH